MRVSPINRIFGQSDIWEVTESLANQKYLDKNDRKRNQQGIFQMVARLNMLLADSRLVDLRLKNDGSDVATYEITQTVAGCNIEQYLNITATFYRAIYRKTNCMVHYFLSMCVEKQLVFNYFKNLIFHKEMTNLLLLDLDGTIRQPASGKQFAEDALDQKLMLGVEAALRHYEHHDWLMVGITNQGGVEAGMKTLDSCIQEQHHTLAIAAHLQSIYFCPDFAGDKCYKVEADNLTEYRRDRTSSFRKPQSGMLDLALAETSLSLNDNVWMVGDRLEDRRAAANTHVKFCHADLWRSRFDPSIHAEEFELMIKHHYSYYRDLEF